MHESPPAPSAAADGLRALLAVGGEHARLDRAVALLAADEDPTADPDSVVASLDDLASRLHLPRGATTVEAVARVNTHLFGRLGFAGDLSSYDDPRNSLLHRVVERRKGLPILLSVLYMEVARRAGLPVDGVGFPGHFVVRPRDADPPFYVDPFHEGAVVRFDTLRDRLVHLVPEANRDAALRERFLGPTGVRQILLRMTNNLRASYLRRADGLGVLRCLERLLLLQPDEPSLRRDRGLLFLDLGFVDAGVHALETYLERHPDVPEAGVLRDHLLNTRSGG